MDIRGKIKILERLQLPRIKKVNGQKTNACKARANEKRVKVNLKENGLNIGVPKGI
jgi:hypothetical protein